MEMTEQPRILQISVSRGGVPKHGIHTAMIGPEGIIGDRQRDRRFHGGPKRAVCIYSIEQIIQLQSEGHPIHPGSTGENITTVGIDLTNLGPGARLGLGENVVIEITSYAVPCRNIRESFHEEEINRMSQKLHPGWSRLYASVVQEGQVAVGDPIRLLAQTPIQAMKK